MKHSLLTLLLAAATYTLHAQCQLGEVALTMVLDTDAWGEENYWELVPASTACGEQTIAWGGNENVGCAATAPDNPDDGYQDDAIFDVGPFCLTLGESYSIIFIDSYGDGGLNFEVYQDGALSGLYVGQNEGNTWTFVAGQIDLPENDSPCNAIPLVLNAAPISCDNTSAITAIEEPSPVGGPCGLSGAWCESDENVTNSLWYSFVAEEGVAYEITTCNDAESFDTQLALYAATDCSDYSTYTLLSSNDDMLGGCGLTNAFASTMYASCLVPGNTYYIQLDGWEGSIGATTLAIYTYAGDYSIQSFVQDVNCPLDKGDLPNGAIELHIIGETIDFTSTWTGPNNFSSTDNWINDLEPGVYEVSILTSCGNTFDASYTVDLPEYWNVSISSTQPDCDESGNGALAISVVGATSPYTFNWTGPDNFLGQGEVLSDLTTGSYSYFITDDNGCEYQGQVLLTPSNSFEFDLGADAVLCLNETEVVVGPLNCTYLWQDESNNQFFEVNASDYGVSQNNVVILTATNDLGCSYTDAFIFSIEDCIFVNEINALGFGIFPNPAVNAATISFESIHEGRMVRVFNAAGQLVFQESTGARLIMDLPVFSEAGIYLVEVLDGSNVQRSKLVVNP